MKLAPLDHDVREIQEVDLEGVQHSLPRHDDLFRLLLDREGPDQGSYFLCRLPLSELAQPLLSGPHDRVDDLEEELAGPGVEDEDGSVDGFGSQVTFEGLVDGDAVHVGVVYKPDYLVAEQFSVVLG